MTMQSKSVPDGDREAPAVLSARWEAHSLVRCEQRVLAAETMCVALVASLEDILTRIEGLFGAAPALPWGEVFASWAAVRMTPIALEMALFESLSGVNEDAAFVARRPGAEPGQYYTPRLAPATRAALQGAYQQAGAAEMRCYAAAKNAGTGEADGSSPGAAQAAVLICRQQVKQAAIAIAAAADAWANDAGARPPTERE